MRKIDRVKKRFVEEGLDVALNRRKGGRIYVKKADGDFEAHLIALSCGEPPEGFAHWSLLNTHNPGSLYESFPPDKAKALWNRFHFVYTPKHGSWLNMAEIELNVLTGQCLKRRIDNIDIVKKEVAAWQKFRNNKNAKVNWQFTAEVARIKLRHLYPTPDS